MSHRWRSLSAQATDKSVNVATRKLFPSPMRPEIAAPAPRARRTSAPSAFIAEEERGRARRSSSEHGGKVSAPAGRSGRFPASGPRTPCGPQRGVRGPRSWSIPRLRVAIAPGLRRARRSRWSEVQSDAEEMPSQCTTIRSCTAAPPARPALCGSAQCTRMRISRKRRNSRPK